MAVAGRRLRGERSPSACTSPLPRTACTRLCAPRKTRYAAPASLSATNAGSEATSSAAMPTLAAMVHTAWPSTTPSAVAAPHARPPRSALRTVSAVSGPGVTMTSAATPTNAHNASIRSCWQAQGRDGARVVRRPQARDPVGRPVAHDLGPDRPQRGAAHDAVDVALELRRRVVELLVLAGGGGRLLERVDEPRAPDRLDRQPLGVRVARVGVEVAHEDDVLLLRGQRAAQQLLGLPLAQLAAIGLQVRVDEPERPLAGARVDRGPSAERLDRPAGHVDGQLVGEVALERLCDLDLRALPAAHEDDVAHGE